MNTILVWILVSVSVSFYADGTLTVVGHFKTREQCVHVQDSILNMPGRASHTAPVVSVRCIQAEIVK